MKRDKTELPKAEASEDETSSSEDDENAELLTDDLETGFFKVLSRLKEKDPKLYDENTRFFSVETSERAAQNIKHKKNRKVKQSKKHYKEWLKGQINKVEDDEVKRDLEALHDFWTNPTLNKDDQFLRDYVLNKKFLEQDKDFNIEEEIEKLEEEEKEVEEALIFEHKYNYRFENPDQDFVKNQQQIMKNPSGKKRKLETEIEHDKAEIEHDETEIEHDEAEIEHDEAKIKHNKAKIKHNKAKIKHNKAEIKHNKAPEIKSKKTITKEAKNKNKLKKKLKKLSQGLGKSFENKVNDDGLYEIKKNLLKKEEPRLKEKLQLKEKSNKQNITSEKKVGGFQGRKHIKKEVLKKSLNEKEEQKKINNKQKHWLTPGETSLEKTVQNGSEHGIKRKSLNKEEQQLNNEKLRKKNELLKQIINSHKKVGVFTGKKHITEKESLKQALGVKAEQKKKKRRKQKHWLTPGETPLEKTVQYGSEHGSKRKALNKEQQLNNEKLKKKNELLKQIINSHKKVGIFTGKKHISEKEALKQALGVKAEQKKKKRRKHKLELSIMEKSKKKRSGPRKKRHRAFKNKLIS